MNDQRLKVAAGVLGAAVIGGALYYYFSSKQTKKIRKNAWRETFKTSTSSLLNLVEHIKKEMELGLKKNEGSSLKMLPTYVSKPSGQEKGTFLALDLGGTNFRVLKLELKGHHTFGESSKDQFTITEKAMNGSADELFNFIADCVGTFLAKSKTTASNNQKLPLGFTFSFPVNQTGIASGTLIEWTKGFSTQGVVGQDVVELLNKALIRENIPVEVVVLANDTVGTMVAHGYKDVNCDIGVILGTGTNACYLEKISNIPKFTGKTSKALDEMIVNMEWGGLSGSSLPLNEIDNELDKASKNVGRYRFEKMISGMYLGEIVRLVLLDLSSKKLIFKNGIPSLLKKPYEFQTAFMSTIQSDKTSDLKEVQQVLKTQLQVESTLEEREIVYDVCDMVSERAARLSAAAIFAVVSKIGKLKGCTVAVDGGVFENYPGFREKMESTIRELDPSSQISLVLSKDGSGIGAACIASSV